ncbi:MAG: HAD family hydrolase [Muribaculaceae bacterium]
MLKYQPKGVLFDLDGVLIDTETQYSVFWGKMGEVYNAGYPDFAQRIKGTNLPAILNTYFPNRDIQAQIVEQLNKFQAKMTYDVYPGVMQFIDLLCKNDIPMCIVTSSDDKKMASLAEHQPEFMSRFKHIITGDQVTHGKPNPECFLKGAKMIDRDISDCLIFEDSLQGITAAIASGAKVIALSTTCSEKEIKKLTNVVLPSINGLTLEKIAELL